MGNDKCLWLRRSNSCNWAAGYLAWFILILLCSATAGQQSSETPECHLVGYTRNVSIPHCLTFPYTSNACYGYCDSSAIMTKPQDLEQNPNQVITSIGTCCDMDETVNAPVSVRCVDGIKDFNFIEAVSCKCSQCKKDSD